MPVCVEANPLSVILEIFKSPIFATPFTKKILAHLRSRWMILCSWRPFNPFSNWKAVFQMKLYSKPFKLMTSER